ncbi:telomere repeat-binding factor 1 isoform X2 [Cornus florida]|nr:telomere repeat-binding factor 1 isoform X2 [Cornus florida]
MGAPKQKWTSEEEAALKAGVAKYGAGKWSTILKDPEFSAILHLRSNVDLKDKWRNMNVAASGWGSRHKARHAFKNNQQTSKHDDDPMALSTVIQSDLEIVDAKPLAICSETLQIAGSKKPISSLDNLILEAITDLKDRLGSNRTAIAMYIEEQYLAPPNLERLLTTNLKILTENGKLTKVKHRYRMAPTSTSSVVVRDSSLLILEGKQKNSPEVKKNDIKILTKSQIDAELEKMRSMTAREAAAAAARAVAEAEAAIAEAAEAAREAEAAEADAEAAQALAEAAMKALKCRALRA